MASGNFEKLIRPLLGIEGGVADRPKSADPGGLTNRGVTHATYDAWRTAQGLPVRSVRDITLKEATAIYREYWDNVRGDDMPGGLDWAMFDFCVNSGAGRAIKELQRVLGTNMDGAIGSKTLAKLAEADLPTVINHYCDARLKFMRGLKNWGPNKNGWTNRVALIRASALSMLESSSPFALKKLTTTATALPSTAKAPDAAKAVSKSGEVQGVSLLTSGFTCDQVRQYAEKVHPHTSMDTPLGRAAFLLFGALMVAGALLWLVAFIRRTQKETGAFGGFIGSVFK